MDVSNDVPLANNLSFGADLDALLDLPVNISQISEDFSHEVNHFATNYEIPGCSNCAQIKQDYELLYHNYTVQFKLLKKRIISTDKLLRRYKAKQDECEQQMKTIQSLTTQIDQMNRDSDILSNQLESLLKEIRPLKEEKKEFEEELCKKSEEISRLKDTIESHEASLRQKRDGDEKSRMQECELTALKKQKATIASKLALTESKLWELKREKKSLNSRVTVNEKRFEVLSKAVTTGQNLLSKYWKILKKNDLTDDEKPSIIPNGYRSLLKQNVDSDTSKTYDSDEDLHAIEDFAELETGDNNLHEKSNELKDEEFSEPEETHENKSSSDKMVDAFTSFAYVPALLSPVAQDPPHCNVEKMNNHHYSGLSESDGENDSDSGNLPKVPALLSPVAQDPPHNNVEKQNNHHYSGLSESVGENDSVSGNFPKEPALMFPVAQDPPHNNVEKMNNHHYSGLSESDGDNDSDSGNLPKVPALLSPVAQDPPHNNVEKMNNHHYSGLSESDGDNDSDSGNIPNVPALLSPVAQDPLHKNVEKINKRHYSGLSESVEDNDSVSGNLPKVPALLSLVAQDPPHKNVEKQNNHHYSGLSESDGDNDSDSGNLPEVPALLSPVAQDLPHNNVEKMNNHHYSGLSESVEDNDSVSGNLPKVPALLFPVAQDPPHNNVEKMNNHHYSGLSESVEDNDSVSGNLPKVPALLFPVAQDPPHNNVEKMNNHHYSGLSESVEDNDSVSGNLPKVPALLFPVAQDPPHNNVEKMNNHHYSGLSESVEDNDSVSGNLPKLPALLFPVAQDPPHNNVEKMNNHHYSGLSESGGDNDSVSGNLPKVAKEKGISFQIKGKCLTQPVSKKTKLIFSQPPSPMGSSDTCSNDSSLSHIFSFFEIPRLLSPLPPSPVEISDDGMFKFGSTPLLVEPSSVKPAVRGLKRVNSLASGPSCSAKKQKVADLNGFASPVEAITLDLKHYLAASDMTMTTIVDNMLGRVDGGDKSKLLQILPPAVVKYVTDQKEDVISEHLMAMCTKTGMIENNLFPSEKKLLDLLANLFKNSERHKLMETIWNGIFSKETKQFASFSLCRLFTGLWKFWGEIEQARILVYNVAWCGYLDVVMCILAVIGVWPEVLSVSYPVGVTSVCSVLQYILENSLSTQPNKLHQVQNVLNRLCLWKVKPAACKAESLLKSLQESFTDIIKNGNKDKQFQSSKAIELLLVHQGPAWTEEYFIKRLLVSVVMKFVSNKNKNDEDHASKLVLVTSLLNILCSVLMVHPVSKTAVTILVKQVFNKLINKKSDNFSLEMACIDALIELTPINPDLCLELIRKWQDNNKGRVPAHTFSKLQLVKSSAQKAAHHLKA